VKYVDGLSVNCKSRGQLRSFCTVDLCKQYYNEIKCAKFCEVFMHVSQLSAWFKKFHGAGSIVDPYNGKTSAVDDVQHSKHFVVYGKSR
jgi:hypothetical protein